MLLLPPCTFPSPSFGQPLRAVRILVSALSASRVVEQGLSCIAAAISRLHAVLSGQLGHEANGLCVWGASAGRTVGKVHLVLGMLAHYAMGIVSNQEVWAAEEQRTERNC